VPLPVPRQRHLPLVQFAPRRSFEYLPTDAQPWFDDRAPATFSIFLGATPGETLSFFLRRIYMPEGEPVQIVSRDTSLVEVQAPEDGFATEASTPVRIRVHGSVSASADHQDVGLAVVWHGKTIHEMKVRVFHKLTIRVACHRVGVGVRYHGELMASLPAAPNFSSLESGLRKFWARAGIDFAFEDAYHDVQVEGPYQGALRVIAPYGELNAAIRQSFVPGKLNLYFAAILADGSGIQLPDRLGQYVPAAQRCIVVRTSGGGSASDGLLATVAHEMGHFLDLRHPYEDDDYGEHDTEPPAGRWFLMHKDATSRYLVPLKWVTPDGPHRLNENGAEVARAAVARYGLTG